MRSTPAPVGPLGRERHEVASTSSVGIWFEVILMQLMVRDIYDQDPRSRRTQYVLSEIADECRHSTMFGRRIEKVGGPAYGATAHVHRLGRAFKTLAAGSARRQTLGNRTYQQTMAWMGERVLAFLDERDLVGAAQRRTWQRSLLMPQTRPCS